MSQDLADYVEQLGRRARAASAKLALLDGATKSAALNRVAAALRDARAPLLAANEKDLTAARSAGVATALLERLKLDDKRIDAIATSVKQIAEQSDPVGQTIEGFVRPNGLRIEKRRVPLGVVLFFYESRPNVTSDAAALCIKSGNAVILRGGKEAAHSNRLIAQIVRASIGDELKDVVQLVDSPDRALVPHLLKLDRYIDLVIPRGGESLIRAVVADATIPVLKHFTGNCHIYIDASAVNDEERVCSVCVNAKTSYPGGAVCNAAEHLLFHRDAAARLLPKVCEDLAARGVEIRGDEATRELFPLARPATAADWDTEYLAFTVSVKVVDSIEDAIEHINMHGSRHTDAILARETSAIDAFVAGVDSASIMVNTSTRFADGGEYGLGAEIGISTDKLHARGPMGASDLTTYKWIVTGQGQVRT